MAGLRAQARGRLVARTAAPWPNRDDAAAHCIACSGPKNLLRQIVKPLLDPAPARHMPVQGLVELGAVVVVQQMAKLVQQNVVDALA